jgi:Cysteine-rich CPCC
MSGGANECSLIDGQQNYERFGACEERFKESVRLPKVSDIRDPQWRLIDTFGDRVLQWDRQEDHQLWQSARDTASICVYYWLPNYWLLRYQR